MNPADRILAVCAEMRAAEEYGLVGPFQYGAWRQTLEDVAAVLNAPQIPPQTVPNPAESRQIAKRSP